MPPDDDTRSTLDRRLTADEARLKAEEDEIRESRSIA
jgi:hypothetical protein